MRRRPALLSAVVAVGAVTTFFCAPHVGYRINTSSSMPVGLWRIVPAPAEPARGMIVVFCMESSPAALLALERRYVEPGPCESGTEPLLKTVAAVGGDTVILSAEGVSIDGELLPQSAPMTEDLAGRPLPALSQGEHHVAPGTVWLQSNRLAEGFDSRYFGPVRAANIIGSAVAVWVW
jgi:conjugative transfer signal peptidase TraF